MSDGLTDGAISASDARVKSSAGRPRPVRRGNVLVLKHVTIGLGTGHLSIQTVGMQVHCMSSVHLNKRDAKKITNLIFY
jgi:hypothetical protein